ncbi:hypothetical protein D9M72_368000 [compost metagenome]
MRARQGCQVMPGDHPVGLLRQPFEHARVGEPVQGIDAVSAAGAEHRLQRDSAHERGFQRPHDDGAHLAVVDAERRRHGQGGEDARLGQTRDRRILEAGQIASAVVNRCLLGGSVVLEVHLHPVSMLRQEGEQLVVGRHQHAVAVHHDPDDRPCDEFLQ